MTAQARFSMPDSIEIMPRRMNFEFDENAMPRYWLDQNPVSTYWLAAMSTVFPVGERFFIQAVRNYQKNITDPQLQQDIKGFIGQEAFHGKEHEAFNEMLQKRGLPVKRMEAMIKKMLDNGERNLPKSRQLAITCALEHFTALLADAVLSDERIIASMDESIRDLFIWHSIEETEHKAVAFDVYQQEVGNYRERVRVMVNVTIALIVAISYIQCLYLRQDQQLFNLKAWAKSMKWFWGKPGTFRKVIPDYLRYFRRDFHPWKRNNAHLIDQWLLSQGELKPRVTG